MGLMVFDVIDEKMNWSDELRRQVQQKYAMSRIIQNCNY